MNNGNSKLIPGISANIMAMSLFILCAVSLLLSGFWVSISVVTFCLTVILFFLDSSSFVRKCSVQTAFLYLVTFVSCLVFRVILGWIPFIRIIFAVIDWAIRIITLILAVISSVQAYNGYLYHLPATGKLIDNICSKLGVF